LQDVRLRFRRSVIGPLWILLNLGIFVGGAGLVYSAILGQPLGSFLPYLITGYVVWGYVLASLTDGSFAFVNAEGYIKQFSYPKEIYLLRSLVSSTCILSIGLLAVLIMQVTIGQFSISGWLMAIPGLVLLASVALGHITISAYLCTRFRDWPHAVSGLMQVAFFITPIMFPATMLKEQNLSFIYAWNPLYYVIDIVRHPIVGEGFPPMSHYIAVLIYLALIAGIATIVARRLDHRVVFLL